MPISFLCLHCPLYNSVTIIHYPSAVRFFMKTFLTVYIGFQSYYILYTNFSSIINFLITMPNFVFIIPIWLSSLVLIHSNDVHVNPGPNNFNKVFSFCNWDCNSIVKNNFNRIDLLKVQASIYNYDVMSLCETSLNDDVEFPESLIDGYNFVALNHPTGNKRGGVGIFYKENLPLKIRKDLSFDESAKYS